MEKPTSQLILEYLYDHPDATVSQISRSLRLTPADIRYHISKLKREGLISISQTIHPGTRGRPARSFTLSQTVKPNNILKLAQAALSIVLKEQVLNINTNLKVLAAQMIPSQTASTGSLTSKIIRLISRLNQSGYSARWEARTQAPCIIFANCPYFQLLDQFPELCEMDRIILENHLAAEVKLDQHIHPRQQKPTTCHFSVQINKKP